MPSIVVAADAAWLRQELRALIEGDGTVVVECTDGPSALAAVKRDSPDVVVLDMQMGNMGAPAVVMDIRAAEGSGTLARTPGILVLIDRPSDVFIVRRSGADAWLDKPVGLGPLRRTLSSLVADPSSWSPGGVGVAALASTFVAGEEESEGSAAAGAPPDSGAVRRRDRVT